jgi:hypothetical protein
MRAFTGRAVDRRSPLWIGLAIKRRGPGTTCSNRRGKKDKLLCFMRLCLQMLVCRASRWARSRELSGGLRRQQGQQEPVVFSRA